MSDLEQLHPADIAQVLKQTYKNESEDEFLKQLKDLPNELQGEVILELPEKLKDKVYEDFTDQELIDLIEELDTDDATDLLQDIEEKNEEQAQIIMGSIEQEHQDDIKWLKRYDEDQAGAFMQTELFEANINETIEQARQRLKKLKEDEEVENIHQVFITNDAGSLIAAIPLEELFVLEYDTHFSAIIEDEESSYTPIKVSADTDIKDVVKTFEKYDLSVVAVVGYKDRLLGRITSDDIYDVIEETATEQIYNLAGVNDDVESEDQFFAIGRKRATWLFINLITAVLASIVIGIFDETITQYVALAVLMPIVASMGGNAGTQTLTIMVRQLALGEVELSNAKEAILKEVYISIMNGLIFAIVSGIIAYVWFGDTVLGYVIGMSMIINLFAAGFFGSVVPLLLKKYDIDPAIGSTVILTTVTDVVGFFSFLALAKYFLL